MIDPSDAQIEVLAACAGLRLDSFCMRPRTSATLVENMATRDVNESAAKLNDLKKQLIFHKVYCALRLQKLEKTKKQLNLVGNQLFIHDRRCSSVQCMKLHKRVKLVIQVESGSLTLPPGQKLPNHPVVRISQPHSSMPSYLQDKLADVKKSNLNTSLLETKISEDLQVSTGSNYSNGVKLARSEDTIDNCSMPFEKAKIIENFTMEDFEFENNQQPRANSQQQLLKNRFSGPSQSTDNQDQDCLIVEENDGDKLIQTGYSTPNSTPRSVYSTDRPYKKPEFKPLVVYENGECVFSTIR